MSKGRQVLFDVRRDRVFRIVHVSTGATGNTPVGHGYPSVPAYPASHGCVRVPMWIALSLFAAHPHGQTNYV